MSEKIYYLDSYQQSVSAKILEIEESEAGRWLLTDRSIFYPGGGGQLPDRGTIGDAPVTSIKSVDEHVWHLIPTEFSAQVGQEIEMRIDWDWRFYNMQQHTGQHLLSHILFERNMPTVSVHLGEDYTLIEVDGVFPDAALLNEIEKLANELIRRALPVRVYWVSREEIGRFPLRKPAGDWQQLRVIEIDGLDYSACGGTHVQNTAEIGLIKLVSVEKIRGHGRIKAFIGDRADVYFTALHQSSAQLKDMLKCEVDQFAARFTAQRDEMTRLKKEREFYRQSFVESQSRQLAAQSADSLFIVHHLAEGGWPDALDIARSLGINFRKIAFIWFENRFALISPDANVFDVQQFMKDFREKLGLNGGGSQGLAQGMIVRVNERQIRQALFDFLESKK